MYIHMVSYSFFSRGRYARLFSVGVLSLAICLMFLNGRTRLHKDSFACLGLLGAGSPASFLCDYSDGGAPIFDSDYSQGRIDQTDFPYLSPQGVIIDLLFYSALILLAWSLVTYTIHLARRTRVEDSEG
jgi:hypothetical protein